MLLERLQKDAKSSVVVAAAELQEGALRQALELSEDALRVK